MTLRDEARVTARAEKFSGDQMLSENINKSALHRRGRISFLHFCY